jgi:hypothetical protein
LTPDVASGVASQPSQTSSQLSAPHSVHTSHSFGYRSPFTQERLESLYTRMCALSPEDRLGVRLQILTESTPFFADCVAALRKLHLLGINGIGARQLEERVAAKYGERETVSRRVRYVLQTLALLGAVENREKKWFVTNLPEL